MMASLARACVSSSRTSRSPASTWSSLRTLISATTPPVGCCTFFRSDSTTSWPAVMTAPDICVFAAQPPTPPIRRMIAESPMTTCRRIDRRSVETRGARHGCDPCRSPTTLSGAGSAGAGGRRRSLASTSSRGPSACTRPLPSTRTVSTAARTPARCATTSAMPLARADCRKRRHQRFLAVGIEVRVGFVQHDEERFPVKRARERHALPLSGGKNRPTLADLRFVAIAKPEYHLMHAGRLRRSDDCR